MKTQTDDQKRLQKHVEHIAKQLTTGKWYDDDQPEDERGAFDYLQDVLDIEYTVTSDKKYIGARVLVAFGGPNIWINTRTKTVEGYWWGDYAEASFEDEMGLDEALEELFNC